MEEDLPRVHAITWLLSALLCLSSSPWSVAPPCLSFCTPVRTSRARGPPPSLSAATTPPWSSTSCELSLSCAFCITYLGNLLTGIVAICIGQLSADPGTSKSNGKELFADPRTRFLCQIARADQAGSNNDNGKALTHFVEDLHALTQRVATQELQLEEILAILKVSVVTASVPSTTRVTVTQEANTPGVMTTTMLPITTSARLVMAVVPCAPTEIAPAIPTVYGITVTTEAKHDNGDDHGGRREQSLMVHQSCHTSRAQFTAWYGGFPVTVGPPGWAAPPPLTAVTWGNVENPSMTMLVPPDPQSKQNNGGGCV
ncbi:hypothetical protein Sjap_023136 [Stephania japonica]|uniref:Uncharacterized protein n=1 Tax=Stephania japonica TaxID=461633 RepID=A0AAP0EB39_9MAGN